MVGVTLLDALDAEPVPTLFVAVTVNVYAVPPDKPETVTGLEPAVPVCPPDEVTVYKVIADPPLLAGAVKATLTAPLS